MLCGCWHCTVGVLQHGHALPLCVTWPVSLSGLLTSGPGEITWLSLAAADNSSLTLQPHWRENKKKNQQTIHGVCETEASRDRVRDHYVTASPSIDCRPSLQLLLELPPIELAWVMGNEAPIGNILTGWTGSVGTRTDRAPEVCPQNESNSQYQHR